MSIRALVVGCDAYPALPGGSLRGAVADALAVREWLLQNGGVRQADLRFLAGCSPDGALIPDDVRVDGPADLAHFALEVEALVTEQGADRLYVYVAGHGCRTDPENPFLAQDVLVLGDFDAAAPQRSCVAVRELTTQLAQGEFGEIVLVLDCCRDFPFGEPFRVDGFGRNWQGRRRSGAAVQFRLQATPPDGTARAGSAAPTPGSPAPSRGRLTVALLDGLAGAGQAKVFDDTDGTGYPYAVRWASLERYLRSALPRQPPISSGQDPGLVLARFQDGHFADVLLTVEVGDAAGSVTLEARYPVPGHGADRRIRMAGPSPLSVTVPQRRTRIVATSGTGAVARSVDAYADTTLRLTLNPSDRAAAGRPGRIMNGPGGSDASGRFEVRSPDPNAMLTIEDASGARRAVGVGSIEGTLPAGSYTAVLADPAGIDPRIAFDVATGLVSEVVLEPAERADGFRTADETALRWSSPAARLAALTREVWANGRRAFLVVGGAADVPPPDRVIAGYPQRFEHSGRLVPDGSGWWVALAVRGPWRSIQLAGHRITVPAVPDSVSAVAVSAAATTVALFDTAHAVRRELAAQDRVQEYLAVGRLGAADLTSRLTLEPGQSWPWAATAAIRRLIDGTRSARLVDESPLHDSRVEPPTEEPPYQFVADVPPDQRHRLVGRGPWAAWLDWP